MEIFKLENIILNQQWSQAKYLEIANLSLEEIKTQEELELNFYLAPIFLENQLFTTITNELYKHYFCKAKNATAKSPFIKLKRFLKDKDPQINADMVLSELVALWIMHAFYDHEILADDAIIYDVNLWKNRYTIMHNLINWLKKLLTFIKFKQGLEIESLSSIRGAFFLQLAILVNGKILMEKKVWGNSKSTIYLSCGPYLKKYNFFYKYKFFLNKPKLIVESEIFFVGWHYSSVNLALHLNWRSKIPIYLENVEFLEKLCDLKYFIDWRMYEKIKNLLRSGWFDDKINTLEELFYHMQLTKREFWKKSSQRYSSRLYMYLVFWNLSMFKTLIRGGFHLSYFVDFRGRIYSNSIISPIGNRIFRYLYTYGNYTNDEVANFKWSDHEKKAKTISLWYLTKLFEKYPNVNTSLDAVIFSLYTVFFEMGKIFKNEYLNEYGGKISWVVFIEKGAYYLLNLGGKSYDFETKLDIEYVINILEKINDNIFEKTIIYKDATASAIQLLMLVLGSDNTERLKQCNLTDAHHWYDTYYFLISDFIKIKNIQADFAATYLSRRLLKKTIMTYNYEATLWSCWNEYAKELKYFDDSTKQTFKDFYNYLEDLFEGGHYYKSPSKTIIDAYKNILKTNKTVEYVTVDGIKINLDYYKVHHVRYEKKLSNLRKSFIWGELTNELDEVKIFRSLRANLIHTLDGCLARGIILKLPHPIITIHDSYGIDILNINILIKAAKVEYTNIKIKNDIIPKSQTNAFEIGSEFLIL